jgi:flagellar protein FliS
MYNAASEYRKTQVLNASGVEVIVLLYDAAVQSMRLAQDGIRRNKPADKARFLGRALNIVGELANVLDMERGGEIAASLRRLYDYIQHELSQANLKNDPKLIDGPIRCMMTLRESWEQIAAQPAMAMAG